jgi:ferrous iron transport protein A
VSARLSRSLAKLPIGGRGVVASLPSQRGLAKRLIALGLTPGAEVRVLQNRTHGPLILEVHGARLALGRSQAERVTLEPEPSAAARTSAVVDK